jgi:hypothetical protein
LAPINELNDVSSSQSETSFVSVVEISLSETSLPVSE